MMQLKKEIRTDSVETAGITEIADITGITEVAEFTETAKTTVGCTDDSQNGQDFGLGFLTDPVIVCLLQLLFRNHSSLHQNTMAGLMKELMGIAEKIGVNPCMIPATPRLLGIRLELLRQVLEDNLGVYLHISMVGGIGAAVQISY